MKRKRALGLAVALALLLIWALVRAHAQAAPDGRAAGAVAARQGAPHGLPPAAPASCANPSFTRTDYPAGTIPNAMAVGDFNGDGHPDLAITNENDNTVTVLLGNAAGSFSPAPGSPFAVDSTPDSVAVGDFNGDGKADLAVTSFGHYTITVLLGDGMGGFSPATGSPFRVLPVPASVAVGDFNGDGHPDLVTANLGANNVTVLLGDGTGRFSPDPGSPVPVGTNPSSVVVGDFNGDGHADLATANSNSGNVTVLLGDGTGHFSPAPGSPFAAGSIPYAVTVGHFNGDSHPDLAVAYAASNNVTVLLGDGTGRFSPAPGSPVPVGTRPYSVAVGDFNGDMRPDLAIANEGSADVTVLLGDGTGRFGPAPSSPFAVGAGPFAVAVGDFNGDTRPDLATADAGANSATVLLNVCLPPPTAGVTQTPTNTPARTATGTAIPTSTATTPPGRTATSTPMPTLPPRTSTATRTPPAPGGTATRPPATGTATPTVEPATATASPMPTAPAATATGLPAAPTATPVGATATGTPCAGAFSDVHPSDYFATPVQYLACHGVISGYADGTFRPYNPATRGQLAKIVVAAVGWPLDTRGGPHFTDVPPGSPFYPFVETAEAHGIISGYDDGTFRPGNTVTRGQLSKIVVGAMAWPLDTRGGPHFTDVAPTNPFYGAIETIYHRGIVSGYADGSFRWGSSATRGQIAKIVYNAMTARP